MWYRALSLGTFRLAFLALIGGFVAGSVREAASFPLEKFDHSVEVSCAAASSCARSLRSKNTLGAYTGIWVRGDAEMNSTFSAKQGILEVKATGASLGGILLSWDSDTYPDQLSSAGLKCVDMRHQGGWAVVLKDFSVNGTCGASQGECPPFVIETRVYDASDPTGQTYSASVLRRANGREVQELMIPYSNFNKKGLRGEGRLGCAGAVSIYVRADGYQDVTLRVGPIFTNSDEPLEALVFTPTPTPPPAAQTTVSDKPITATATPTFTPTVQSTASLPPAVEGSATPEGTPDVPQAPTLGKVVVAPLGTPEVEPERAPEEAVYGEIINE
jgi:hypothetical protein